MAALRCPKCSHVFDPGQGPIVCPSCGLRGSGPPATPAGKSALPVWVPLAIFAVIVLLIVGFITFRFQAGEDIQPLEAGSDAPILDAPAFTPDQDPSQGGGLRNATGVEPESGTVTFTGSGEGRTNHFTVDGGLLQVDFDFRGKDGYFSLKFFAAGSAGQPNETVLAPEPGPIAGRHIIVLAPGDYDLHVGTSGDTGSWRVDLSHPSSADAQEGRVAGQGFDAFAVGLGQGAIEIQFQAASSGAAFQVEMFDWRGQRLPETTCGASGYGGYDNTKTCQIPEDGPYFVNVVATDAWSLAFA